MASLVACAPPYYTADPIEAWVVDAETGQPIEGAVVTANWQLVSVGLDTGGRKLHQLEVKETRTDKNGRFYFPGFTKLNNMVDELREEDPQLLIFKPGYKYYRASNSYLTKDTQPGSHRVLAIRGERIALNKGDGDIEKYAFDLGFLTSSVANIVNSGNTDNILQMVRAIYCEQQRITRISQHASGYVMAPGASAIMAETNCESN